MHYFWGSREHRPPLGASTIFLLNKTICYTFTWYMYLASHLKGPAGSKSQLIWIYTIFKGGYNTQVQQDKSEIGPSLSLIA